MAFPRKLYMKLQKLDFITGLAQQDGKLIVYVSHELNDSEKKMVGLINTNLKTFVVAGPVQGA